MRTIPFTFGQTQEAGLGSPSLVWMAIFVTKHCTTAYPTTGNLTACMDGLWFQEQLSWDLAKDLQETAVECEQVADADIYARWTVHCLGSQGFQQVGRLTGHPWASPQDWSSQLAPQRLENSSLIYSGESLSDTFGVLLISQIIPLPIQGTT